jgi:hypothetical protein
MVGWLVSRTTFSGQWAPPIDPANLATSARPRHRNNARRCTLQSFNNEIRNQVAHRIQTLL